jgi:tRNA-specific 2-thiouridylase
MKKKKVIIGLSGGVDSSVSALLLKQQGYEVEGVFMRNWDSSLNYDIQGNRFFLNNMCPQEQDYQDVLKVCEQLKIKCHRINFIEEYWNKVFISFLNQIKKNLTPNPDVLCNNQIKFKTFIEYAKKLKTDYIAMGHYAQIIFYKNNFILKKALDSNKDQTYFLSQLEEKQIKNIIFPLGKIKKEEVRIIAKKENLINADKKDSTGICFIGERNFFNFLNNYFPIKKGPIKNILDGTVLKEHDGVIRYTIGQRKKLNLKVNKQNQGPWFVVGKELKTNTLYVDQNNDSSFLYSDSALIVNIVWRNYNLFFNNNDKIKLEAKFRYRQPDQKIEMEWINKKNVKIYYKQKIKLVTPGQICAFYKDDFCIGAGMILEVYSNNKKLIYT